MAGFVDTCFYYYCNSRRRGRDSVICHICFGLTILQGERLFLLVCYVLIIYGSTYAPRLWGSVICNNFDSHLNKSLNIAWLSDPLDSITPHHQLHTSQKYFPRLFIYTYLSRIRTLLDVYLCFLNVIPDVTVHWIIRKDQFQSWRGYMAQLYKISRFSISCREKSDDDGLIARHSQSHQTTRFIVRSRAISVNSTHSSFFLLM